MSIDSHPVLTPQCIALKTLKIEAAALLKMCEQFNESFNDIIQLLLKPHKKVILMGIGKSGLIAQKIAATLCSTGTPAIFLHAVEALHGDLGVYSPGDPTILISKSGSTAELTRLIPILRDFNSPLIGILGNCESPLGHAVDYTINASVEKEADPLGIVPTTSTTLSLAIGDAIAAALMHARGFQSDDFARYHPSGQLGRSLTLKVKDVMHPLSKIATVTPEAPLKTVVIGLSKHPLGGACVLDQDNHLLGFITDGDIRRALTHHDDIRHLKAKDIMTTAPTYTFLDVSLADAIRQMEDRPSQITVLPVKSADSELCLGLVRLHDIYQPHLV